MVRNSGRSLLDGNMGCFEAISLCFCSDVFRFQPLPCYCSMKYIFKSCGNFYHDQLLDFLIPPQCQATGSWEQFKWGRCNSTHISRRGTGWLCFGLMSATMTSRTLPCLVLYLCWFLATLQQFAVRPHNFCDPASSQHHNSGEGGSPEIFFYSVSITAKWFSYPQTNLGARRSRCLGIIFATN